MDIRKLDFFSIAAALFVGAFLAGAVAGAFNEERKEDEVRVLLHASECMQEREMTEDGRLETNAEQIERCSPIATANAMITEGKGILARHEKKE